MNSTSQAYDCHWSCPQTLSTGTEGLIMCHVFSVYYLLNWCV